MLLRCLLKIFLISLVSANDPLFDYVMSPDPYYKYDLIETYNFNEHDIYVINMTSQKWRDGL